MLTFTKAGILTLTLAAVCGQAGIGSPPVGYTNTIANESASDRETRRCRIAQRREGPVVLVHRGASAFAPENTLEAYAAAMDYGADGCEVDIRRTADGVLVLFHDDMLDRLTSGFGTIDAITYPQLLALDFPIYGTARPGTLPPTFAALLALSRQRAMLLHLDIKQPGLDDDIAGMLDEADLWDHVVFINDYNSQKLRGHLRFKPLSFKAPGLFEQRLDWDPQAVTSALAKPGDMIIVDDPRLAARELKRPPFEPVSLPDGLRTEWERVDAPLPAASLAKLAGASVDELVALLAWEDGTRRRPDGDECYQRERTNRILVRAWAAQRLGQMGVRSGGVVEALEDQLRNRSLHRDWRYHGLDGAMAARALGTLGAVEAVPVLIEAFTRVDPDLARVANPQWTKNPLSWTDYRTRMYILPALGDLRCDESRRFLNGYLSMEEARARELAPPLFGDAARALLRHDLAVEEIESLLRGPHSAVRGIAIQECLDHPSDRRTAALRSAAPWALDLPRAR